MLHTRKAQTEEAQAAMAERNARRVEIAKRALGEKYAHHPVNQVKRLDAPRTFPTMMREFQMIGRALRKPPILKVLPAEELAALRERIKRAGIAPGSCVPLL